MANICRNCGNYLQDTDTFCDKCGTPVYGGFNPNKKSQTGLILALIVSSVAILTTVILLYVAPGFLVKKKDKKNDGGTEVASSSTADDTERVNPDNTEVASYYTTEQSTAVTERTEATTEQTTAAPNTSSTTGTLAYTFTEATDDVTTEATTAATTQSTTQVGSTITTEATTQATTQAATQGNTEVTTESTTQVPPVDSSKPDFEKYGIRTDLPLGGNMDIIGRSTDGYKVEIKGKVSVDAFTRTGVSEEVMAFGKENGLDSSNYEELRVRYHAFFDDTRLYTIGLTIMPCSYDYYNVKLYEDTKVEFYDNYESEYDRFTIKYKDKERYVYRWITSNWTDYNDYAVYDCEIIYYVPAGYDGIVYGFRDPAHDENGYIYDNYDSSCYQLFRLK